MKAEDLANQPEESNVPGERDRQIQAEDSMHLTSDVVREDKADDGEQQRIADAPERIEGGLPVPKPDHVHDVKIADVVAKEFGLAVPTFESAREQHERSEGQTEVCCFLESGLTRHKEKADLTNDGSVWTGAQMSYIVYHVLL